MTKLEFLAPTVSKLVNRMHTTTSKVRKAALVRLRTCLAGKPRVTVTGVLVT